MISGHFAPSYLMSSMKRAIGLPATPPVNRVKNVVFALFSPRPRRGTSMYPGGARRDRFHASGTAARGWVTS